MSTVPMPTPADFRRDFPDLYRSYERQIAQLQGKQLKHPSAGSAESQRLVRRANDLAIQMDAQGWTPAMVINMNPFPVKLNGVLHDEELPACPLGTKYVAVCISRWAQEIRDNGDGNWTCHAWVPLQLAKDYESEATFNKWGGIFVYPGTILPDDPEMPPDLKRRVTREFQEAEARMVRWAKDMYRIADATWASPRGDKMIIDDRHRKAGLLLISLGFLKEEQRPPWLDATTAEKNIQVSCKGCGNRCEPGVVQCGNCNYVFDPERAYLNGMIEDHHSSLKRLHPEVLKRLELTNIKSIWHLMPEEERTPIAGPEIAPEDAELLKKFTEGAVDEEEEEKPAGVPAIPGAPAEDPQILAHLKEVELRKKAAEIEAKLREQSKGPADPKPPVTKPAAKAKTAKPKSEMQKKAEKNLGQDDGK